MTALWSTTEYQAPQSSTMIGALYFLIVGVIMMHFMGLVEEIALESMRGELETLLTAVTDQLEAAERQDGGVAYAEQVEMISNIECGLYKVCNDLYELHRGVCLPVHYDLAALQEKNQGEKLVTVVRSTNIILVRTPYMHRSLPGRTQVTSTCADALLYEALYRAPEEAFEATEGVILTYCIVWPADRDVLPDVDNCLTKAIGDPLVRLLEIDDDGDHAMECRMAVRADNIMPGIYTVATPREEGFLEPEQVKALIVEHFRNL